MARIEIFASNQSSMARIVHRVTSEDNEIPNVGPSGPVAPDTTNAVRGKKGAGKRKAAARRRGDNLSSKSGGGRRKLAVNAPGAGSGQVLKIAKNKASIAL